MEEKEKKQEEIAAINLQKEKAKSKESWKIDEKNKERGKSGIKGSKIQFGGGPRGSTPLRERGSGPGSGSVHGQGTPGNISTMTIGTPSTPQSSSHSHSHSHSSHSSTGAVTTTGVGGGGGTGLGGVNISSVRGSVSTAESNTDKNREKEKEKAKEKESKVFDKESAESEVLSNTAHLSTSELRNR